MKPEHWRLLASLPAGSIVLYDSSSDRTTVVVRTPEMRSVDGSTLYRYAKSLEAAQ